MESGPNDIAKTPDQNPNVFAALSSDLQRIGIGAQQLEWVRTDSGRWQRLLERIQRDCIQARPTNQAPKNPTPKSIYDLTLNTIQRRGIAALDQIALEAGVPRQEIPKLFGLTAEALNNPLRKAYDLAIAGKDLDESLN